jgi:LGFP repeat
MWRRWLGGGDPPPHWTLSEFIERFGGSGVLATAVGEETDSGDGRGRRREFRGSLAKRRRRVSSRPHADLKDAAYHRRQRALVEIEASVFWSEETGAHVVMGEIRDEYLRMGGPQSELGYPIANEADSADHLGRISHFEGGDIVWDPDSGVAVVGRRGSGGDPGH